MSFHHYGISLFIREDEVTKGHIPELGLSCALICNVPLLVSLTLFYFVIGFIGVFNAGQIHM